MQVNLVSFIMVKIKKKSLLNQIHQLLHRLEPLLRTPHLQVTIQQKLGDAPLLRPRATQEIMREGFMGAN